MFTCDVFAIRLLVDALCRYITHTISRSRILKHTESHKLELVLCPYALTDKQNSAYRPNYALRILLMIKHYSTNIA